MEGKQEQTGREIIPCEHIAEGKPVAASIGIGINRSVALCAKCLEPVVRKILADGASVVAATLVSAYTNMAEEGNRPVDDTPVEYPTKEA